MALRIRSETGVVGCSRELALAGVDQLYQTHDAVTHAVANQRHTHVAVKVPTDLGGVGPSFGGQGLETQLWRAAHDLQDAPREHVRRVAPGGAAAPGDPVNALPKLGAELLGAWPIDDLGGSGRDRAELVFVELEVHWQRDIAFEHLRRIVRRETNRKEIQVAEKARATRDPARKETSPALLVRRAARDHRRRTLPHPGRRD